MFIGGHVFLCIFNKLVDTEHLLKHSSCHYFFARKRSTIQLWKTRKFRLFNHHVLEELSLMAKFRFAKSIAKMPKGVAGDIDRLNALRNGLAHAFLPENLKRSKHIRTNWWHTRSPGKRFDITGKRQSKVVRCGPASGS